MRKFALLLLFSAQCFSQAALGFLVCEKYLGGNGDKRPDLWERIKQQKATPADQITIEFLRNLIGEGPGTLIKFPRDYDVTPGPGGSLYFPNSMATKQILQILTAYKHRVLIGPNAEIGYLIKAEHSLEEQSEFIDFRIRENRDDKKSKAVELSLESGYQFELAEILQSEIAEGVSGTLTESFRFLKQTLLPKASSLIDGLNSRGQINMPAGGKVQIQTFIMLGGIGLNVEVAQNNTRKMGRLIGFEEIPDESPIQRWVPTPNYEAKKYRLRLLKLDALKNSDCESQFDFYSRPRYFSSHQADELRRYNTLQTKCTDQLEVDTSKSLRLEIW